MSRISSPILFLIFFISLFFSSSARSCQYTFPKGRVFKSCITLPVLNSFLHWTCNPSGTVNIAYRHTGIGSSRWVAWAINPRARGMVGSQAFVAYQLPNGAMRVYAAPVTSYTTQLKPGVLSFAVSDLSATYANKEMIIYATLRLPRNMTVVNQVWQEGPLWRNTPIMHPTSGENLDSMGIVNFHSR
ncbi:PREDICTED: cytochrome b561 and DOMON domain-containing protein At5g47530-like [Nelumbo nucifera]|uniref:Cytochrome b561 and DOMON domain-containing protein At5g47530-like n=2 Tax=Nelumbo nucifera TaxID=4432 RepID=A0A1U8BI58_NELNU|nr:PREDICTED: cytochrome b561 and DOMON domain-containing protein At5g47530-like [Nelumbo nucifera]DAD42796.1 TPA_asm: hypothetical protein HUJ06_001026 [Nelumbo nucifera]